MVDQTRIELVPLCVKYSMLTRYTTGPWSTEVEYIKAYFKMQLYNTNTIIMNNIKTSSKEEVYM